MAQLTSRLVDWASASRPHAGGEESGDAYLVQVRADSVLVAVVDGLGHGIEAAAAAGGAIADLAAATWQDPLETLRHCHERLRATRGVVMSLARFEVGTSTMTWAGVGNVEGALLRSNNGSHATTLTLRQCHGVVGRRLPTLHAARLPVVPGDTLVFATDGIGAGFSAGVECAQSPRNMADAILRKYASGADDALAVVVRWEGVAL
jgi:serine phosphatase RsbU (regulator of sigma subunit)